jgi:hypothetical protein
MYRCVNILAQRRDTQSILLQQISLTLYGDEQFAAFCLFIRTLPIDFALLNKIQKIKGDSKIKRQTNLDCCGPRPISIICHLTDAPSFSLLTTFKTQNLSGHRIQVPILWGNWQPMRTGN